MASKKWNAYKFVVDGKNSKRITVIARAKVTPMAELDKKVAELIKEHYKDVMGRSPMPKFVVRILKETKNEDNAEVEELLWASKENFPRWFATNRIIQKESAAAKEANALVTTCLFVSECEPIPEERLQHEVDKEKMVANL